MFIVLFSSIKVTIYAVKTPSGNSTDLNDKLSQAKEYLTRDDILKVLLDEDGNLSPNITNDKELEVRKCHGAGRMTVVQKKLPITANANIVMSQSELEANTCYRCQLPSARKHAAGKTKTNAIYQF